MAIINNNVENVQFLRNQNPFESREAARTALENNKGQAADGTSLLARYSTVESGATVIKTIVGYVAVVGTTHHLTIIDVEGASGDVEELREEINAKLGEGITSENTATEQLAALSGNTASTSAETSVEGAKRYADELKKQMDYSGVTTGTGVYVTNVTQADGIVSATTATLPSVTDAKEAKKVVVSVSEDKGVISIERGTISSSASTMVLTDNTDGGVNFEVNIDNNTIIQDADTKRLKVDDAALVQYVGDEDTIHISAVDAQNKKTISSPLTISATTPTEENVKEQYNLVGSSGNTIGATIKIYKDSSVVEIYVGTKYDSVNTTTGVIDKKEIGDVVDEHTIVAEDFQYLNYVYHKDDGAYEMTQIDLNAFLVEPEFKSGVTVSNGVVIGVVDSASEKDSQSTPVDFLTVGENGFKISGIKNEIDRKLNAVVEGLDATVTDSTSGNHVTITIEELDGKLVQSGLTIEENDIASATDLAALSGKTITDVKSANGSVTVTPGNAADGTKEIDLATDASKIKMSGFTSTDALSGINSSSSITEAFKEVDNVITKNERVTAAALTDLDGRLDVIESGYVETVKVNDVELAETNNTVNVQIASAPATGAASSPITVTTEPSTGAVTLIIQGIDCGYYDGTQG